MVLSIVTLRNFFPQLIIHLAKRESLVQYMMKTMLQRSNGLGNFDSNRDRVSQTQTPDHEERLRLHYCNLYCSATYYK
jgi:hypothetical protein